MLPEPELLFDYDQTIDDPRDGLTLFGPRRSTIYGINYGVIGTPAGIERFSRWIKKANEFTAVERDSQRLLWIPFPGFESIFRIPFSDTSIKTLSIDENILKEILRDGDTYQRVFNTVNLYEQQIVSFYQESDQQLNLWYVISPESVYRECRPKSEVEVPIRKVTKKAINVRKGIAQQSRSGQGFIFEDMEQDYFAYDFDADFRRQLKARLIMQNVRDPVQIFRESTLTPDDFLNRAGYRERDVEPESQVAWNVFTTSYYKAGGKPWKLASLRDGVCYLGMVYKQLENSSDDRSACCAAQMFLDSGDGVIFKGAIGPWKSLERDEYHLNKNAAKEIISKAISTYQESSKDHQLPKQIFIHGRTFFNDEEWTGFSDVPAGVSVVGIRIASGDLKLYRPGNFPVLRGTAYIETEVAGYLWTTGFVPKLRTSPHLGVPTSVKVDICRGSEDIKIVLEDILALTKLNYNACHYADGYPITLQFADKIGDILTAGPIEKDQAPKTFKYYI